MSTLVEPFSREEEELSEAVELELLRSVLEPDRSPPTGHSLGHDGRFA